MDNNKIFDMSLSKIYPLLVAKVERKGRSEKEVITVICWLTGYGEDELLSLVNGRITYGEFFEKAPAYNVKAEKITGTVCGVRVETIADPLMKKIRQLDKLIDELAKGKPLVKILRD